VSSLVLCSHRWEWTSQGHGHMHSMCVNVLVHVNERPFCTIDSLTIGRGFIQVNTKGSMSWDPVCVLVSLGRWLSKE